MSRISENSPSLFLVSEENCAIMIINNSAEIFLCGALDIQVIYGKIEIMGYELEANNSTLSVYSLKGFYLLGIKALAHQSSSLIDNISSHVSNILGSQDLVGKTVILIRKNHLAHQLVHFITKHIRFSLLPLEQEYVLDVEKELNFLVETVEIVCKHFTASYDWYKIERVFSEKSRLILCGGKGVGKSSCLRYFVNRCLNEHKSVLVLDFDPGQTEFTIMGSVSAVLVKKPLLGPNFTHITDPIKSVYIGEISVVNQISMYMKAVQCVVSYCKEKREFKNIPWFINTMGFNKGLGVEIICATIRCVQPTDVMQISSSNKNDNYPFELKKEKVLERDLLEPKNCSNLDYRLHITRTLAKGVLHCTFSAYRESAVLSLNKRNMMTLAYFYKSLNTCDLNDLVINGVVPYKVKLDDFELKVMQGCIDKKDALCCLNMNMIALCNCSNDNGCFCIGYGIVRGVDLESGELYIITPVEEQQLTNVNTLIYSSEVEAPDTLFTKQECSFGQVPYVEPSKQELLSRPFKRTPRKFSLHVIFK